MAASGTEQSLDICCSHVWHRVRTDRDQRLEDGAVPSLGWPPRPVASAGNTRTGNLRPEIVPAYALSRSHAAARPGDPCPTRSDKLVIRDVLFEQIDVREAGEPKKMSVLEAILKKVTDAPGHRG
jgi:hypothetical protein